MEWKKKIASGYHVIRHIDRIGYLWTIGNELDNFKKYGWIFNCVEIERGYKDTGRQAAICFSCCTIYIAESLMIFSLKDRFIRKNNGWFSFNFQKTADGNTNFNYKKSSFYFQIFFPKIITEIAVNKYGLSWIILRAYALLDSRLSCINIFQFLVANSCVS